MKICKCCKINEATKKNTHYLTDAIIRPCLNIDGSNKREKGLYFDMSNTNPFVESNFQKLSEEEFKKKFKRNPTEEEIEKAKLNTPFSVDFIFCKECEDKFTKIETEFIEKILPKFRNTDLTNISDLLVDENIICRKFFLLQIFRSAICEPIYSLSSELIEKLRKVIYNGNIDKSIPLSITYLQTLDKPENFTENFVGLAHDKNPYLIFMNDFIIQCYDNKDNIKLVEFYGLNKQNYKDFINVDEDKFIFKIFNNEERKEFLRELILNEKVRPFLKNLEKQFLKLYFEINKTLPSRKLTEKYIKSISDSTNNKLNSLSKKEIISLTKQFFKNINKQ